MSLSIRTVWASCPADSMYRSWKTNKSTQSLDSNKSLIISLSEDVYLFIVDEPISCSDAFFPSLEATRI